MYDNNTVILYSAINIIFNVYNKRQYKQVNSSENITLAEINWSTDRQFVSLCIILLPIQYYV